uniref:Uncharacterized protein n=1 Tax=Avena sativa TaxID=4498 RepID=A0ACD5U048_AVESA
MEEAAAAPAMRAPKRHRSDYQQVPPGGGGSGGGEGLDDLDLISGLPDAVLGTIVSLLPTKDGARTQVLSRRWLPLWRSHMAPLNLVADRHLSDNQSRAAVVSKILSDHPGPARRFSLHIISLRGFRAKVPTWFRSDTLNGLQELEVTNLHNKRYPLPRRSLTRFAPTLRLLKLGSCYRLRVLGIAVPSFPHLKQLILYKVCISEKSLECLISSCVALESVSLQSVGFSRLCISSQTLRCINLHALRSKGGELVIEDAPCLERLLPDFPKDGPPTIRVISAPKLEILGFLSKGISTLDLGTMVFQKMVAVSLTTKMQTMKVLSLNIGANLDYVVDFLKCFPCLEKLYVILHDGKDINSMWKHEPLDSIECLELHLKKVVLKNYKRSFIDFAKFFILNAKVLKEMEIRDLSRESEKSMCYQLRELQVEYRASRDAQIVLRSDTIARPTNYGHTYDLSMADPFDSPFCGCDKCVTYI